MYAKEPEMAAKKIPMLATAGSRQMRFGGAKQPLQLHQKAVLATKPTRHYDYVVWVANIEHQTAMWTARNAAIDEMGDVPEHEEFRTRSITFADEKLVCVSITHLIADTFYALRSEKGWVFQVFRSLDGKRWARYAGPSQKRIEALRTLVARRQREHAIANAQVSARQADTKKPAEVLATPQKLHLDDLLASGVVRRAG